MIRMPSAKASIGVIQAVWVSFSLLVEKRIPISPVSSVDPSLIRMRLCQQRVQANGQFPGAVVNGTTAEIRGLLAIIAFALAICVLEMERFFSPNIAFPKIQPASLHKKFDWFQPKHPIVARRLVQKRVYLTHHSLIYRAAFPVQKEYQTATHNKHAVMPFSSQID